MPVQQKTPEIKLDLQKNFVFENNCYFLFVVKTLIFFTTLQALESFSNSHEDKVYNVVIIFLKKHGKQKIFELKNIEKKNPPMITSNNLGTFNYISE